MSTSEAHQRGPTYGIFVGIVVGVLVANFFDEVHIGASAGACIGGVTAVIRCNRAEVRQNTDVKMSWKNLAILLGTAGSVVVIMILLRRLG